MPATYALAAYAGSVRGALLQYKEKGRRELTGDLGEALARVVVRALSDPFGGPAERSMAGGHGAAGRGRAEGRGPDEWGRAEQRGPDEWGRAEGRGADGWGRAGGRGADGWGRAGGRGERAPRYPGAGRREWRAEGPVVLVPVPATAAAVRERHGDHVVRLAKAAAALLPGAGVVMPLRALPKRRDSAELSAAERARAAQGAFAVVPAGAAALRERVAAGASVVIVDDIVTTGVTLAAAAAWVVRAARKGGGSVPRAAVLAATQRQRGV